MGKSLRQVRAELRLLDCFAMLALGIGLILTSLLALRGHDRSGIVSGCMAIVIILALEWIRRPMRRNVAAQEAHAAKVLSAMSSHPSGANSIDANLDVLWVELNQPETTVEPGCSYWHCAPVMTQQPLHAEGIWATHDEATKDLLLGRAMAHSNGEHGPLQILHLTPARPLRLANFKGVSLDSILNRCTQEGISLQDALGAWAGRRGMDGVCGTSGMNDTAFAQPESNLVILDTTPV